MPENQPPENDPFADLYGRLPDPRTGARASNGAAAADGEEAPPSRRAAREARRAQIAATPTTTPESPQPRADAVPRDAEQAFAPREAAPSNRESGQPRTSAPERRAEDSAGRSEPSVPVATRRTDDAVVPGPRRTTPAETRPSSATAAPLSTPAAAAQNEPSPRAPSKNAPGQDAAQPARAVHSAAWQAAARRADAPRPAERAPTPLRDAGSSRPAEPSRDREPALVGAGAATAAAGSSASGAAASGSLEDLFTGQTTTQQIGSFAPKPPKRRRRIGGWIALAIVLIIVGGIAGGGFALWNTYGDRVQAFFGAGESLEYEAGQATGEARVTIVSGDTGQSVSPKLFDAGVTKASNSLYKYMVDNAVGFTFQPGVYKLQQQMTSEAVLAALRDPANRLDNSVQLREGLTLKQSLDVISEQTGIARTDLDAATADPAAYGVTASTLEGWIFPATYDFDDGVTAQQVIDRMVKRTIESLDKAGVAPSDRERILTIASIIEREARSSEDFYKVSRVIENRLQPDNTETHGLLQMDSTAQYGANELDAGSSSSSENALTSDNPYNTYKHPGLPVGPIANAGDLAIDAAMHPVDGPWYYFTTVNLATGETVFSTSYADQEKAVAQFQQWCRENPNGGC